MSVVRGLLSDGGWMEPMETVFNIPGVRLRGRGSLDRRLGGGGQQTKFLTLVSNR